MKKIIPFILIIVLAYLIFFKKMSHQNTKRPTFSTRKLNIKGPKSQPNQKKPKVVIESNATKPKPESISTKRIKGQKILSIEEQMAESKKTMDSFTEETKMIIPSMPNMTYSLVDIGNDDVAIVHGETQKTNRTLTVIATRGVINPDEALKFLKDEGNLIPGFGKNGLQLAQQAYSIPSIPGKGFTNNHTVFIGKPNKSGITTNGILMTRADGKGTYLYLLKTHMDFFDKNEGLMDQLYEEISLSDYKSDKK